MSPENSVRLEILRSAPLDSWIALSEDETRIIAIGKSYAEVSDASDLAGVEDPLILKTPPMWGPMYRLIVNQTPISSFSGNRWNPDVLGFAERPSFL